MDNAEVDQACNGDDDEASDDVCEMVDADIDTREADEDGADQTEEPGPTTSDHRNRGRRRQEKRVVGRKAVVGRAMNEGLEAADDKGPRVLNEAVSDEG